MPLEDDEEILTIAGSIPIYPSATMEVTFFNSFIKDAYLRGFSLKHIDQASGMKKYTFQKKVKIEEPEPEDIEPELTNRGKRLREDSDMPPEELESI